MSLLEQIQKEVVHLPPEKQSEVLDFILFLRRQLSARVPSRRSLKDHPAFGSWKGRGIDALEFQEQLRSEWEREE
ncbi:MAG: DUF2281 domain-containing protein [Thermoflexales bacterium]|nr:DUF2281 domain-containing protein [Thermoflexales bacterium]